MQLNPCPFCHKVDILYDGIPQRNLAYVNSFMRIVCRCGANGPSAKTPTEAIELWNRPYVEVELYSHPPTYTVRFDEGDRQMVLLALSHLAVERPGWLDALETLARTMDSVDYDSISGVPKPRMFTQFRRMHKQQVSGKDEENPVRRVKIRR